MVLVLAAVAVAAPAWAGAPNSPLAPNYVAPPTPPLPDVGTFDALLFDLARPPDPDHPRGMTTSNPDLAVRAGSAALIPDQGHDDPNSLAVLGQSTLTAPLTDFPTGEALVSFLDPSGSHKASEMHLRDLGPMVLAQQGPLQRTSRAVFGPGVAGTVGAMGLIAGAALGATASLGTSRAQLLGLNPSLKAAWLDGQLNLGAGLRSDPHFANAAVDASGRYHLLQVERKGWHPYLHDLYVEAGATAARTGDHLPNKWAKLRLNNTWLDSALGIQSPSQGPPSLTLEALATRGDYRLRTVLTRQQQTGVAQILGSMAYRRGPAELGLFMGEHTTQGLSAGILAMSVF